MILVSYNSLEEAIEWNEHNRYMKELSMVGDHECGCKYYHYEKLDQYNVKRRDFVCEPCDKHNPDKLF